MNRKRYYAATGILPVLASEEEGETSVADSEEVSPLAAALIGDAWFTLYVRRRLLDFEQRKVRRLHDWSAKMVSAVCQAKAYHRIETYLTDEEREIFRRGRNAKSHAPKSAGVVEYHISTGFEALLGVLYLRGDFARLQEIGAAAFRAIIEE